MSKWPIMLAILAASVASTVVLLAWPRDEAVVAIDREKPLENIRLIQEIDVSLADMSVIANEVAESSDSKAFAAFAFYSPDRPSSDEAVNVQFSVENGELGLDWVLLSETNVADRVRFEAFARQKGMTVSHRTLNGVYYPRVENSDVVGFAESIVIEMYGLPGDVSLSLYHEGFEWPIEP